MISSSDRGKINGGFTNGVRGKGLEVRKSYINGGGKPVGPRKRKGKRRVAVVITVIFVIMVSSLVVITYRPSHTTSNGFVLGESAPFEKSYNPSVINNAKFLGYMNKDEKIGIGIGFKWRNAGNLNEFLREVNNPKSPRYRHFLTWKEFKDKYAPPSEIYNATIEWLEGMNDAGIKLHIEHTWAMRNDIVIYDTVGNIEKVFHTQFGIFQGDGIHTKNTYYAALDDLWVPANLQPYLSGIEGTNNAPAYHLAYYTDSSSSTNYNTGADIAKMDRVFELYNDTSDGSASTKHIFATGLRVATVLWEGSTGNGANTQESAPFDPAAVNYYYQHVIPTWIQNLGIMSHAWGYGTESDTVPPGSNTDGSVSGENELDLEMVGTLAPGVDVVCVYSDSSQTNFPYDNFDYILNVLAHNSTLVAVSNSWGYNSETAMDATTMSDVQALNALGVTVMASTGDDSSGAATTPATAAYNDYGFLGIGGTTPSPNGINDTTIEDWATMAYNTNTTDPRIDEVVWNWGTGSGTQCGVSTIYPEPWWQNVTIGTGYGGRVVADISTMGDRTMVVLSDGTGSYSWQTGYGGTSFSCPITAGIFAEMAAYAGRYYDGHGLYTNQTSIYGFGFFAPTLYLLGYDFYNNSKYSSSPPFFDVVSGSTDSGYSAAPGYDLPSGWGVPNAYEIIHDIGPYMGSAESSQTVNAGESTYYNIEIWFPYNWTSEMGHFEVQGLPSGATYTTNVTYVHPLGNGAVAWVNFTITTSTTTPTGTYTLTVLAYTYNHTSNNWGNLSASTTVTLVVNAAVPEFSSSSAIPIILLTLGLLAVWRRRKKL